MSWNGHNDDGVIERSWGDEAADERHRQELESRDRAESNMRLVAMRYLRELLEHPDGPPFTHFEGMPVDELKRFIEERTRP